ncbi:hypothetical protein A3A67_00965 [Candidatus Peribacteria bacterium RIFCSPLOWO2_01_FULL_51_18]|nr:MAG: hypothetical protein A3A67_00965 [Candidatus Peribacteria bacterium RIFCSPLOWO2_01_FULL_51_18]
MVAARDPLFKFMHAEAERGKVIIGNCNGAQVLVESGLIPLGDCLRMCLARNAIQNDDGSYKSPGFLNEWVWITPACDQERCATSNWTGTMQIPIAHGEGRFVTCDQDLVSELEKNDQVAFRYCDANGTVSIDEKITPNGSTGAIAGICNPQGNVVALMPHPERTSNGDAYFISVRKWIEKGMSGKFNKPVGLSKTGKFAVNKRKNMPFEIFIDTIITNNEERTVEQAARRIIPELKLKQYRYVGLGNDRIKELLSHLLFFNPNKETAFVNLNGAWKKWNSDKKKLQDLPNPLKGISLLRRDIPDTGGSSLGGVAETGICYDCRDVSESDLFKEEVCEVFCNPHSSTLELIIA